MENCASKKDLAIILSLKICFICKNLVYLCKIMHNERNNKTIFPSQLPDYTANFNFAEGND
jgi:hypothetical protein